MIKMRKKSGLRRAQITYQGNAVAQNARIATGCNRRNASRQRFVNIAQKKIAPPHRIIAAGPLASTAKPKKSPKEIKPSHGVRGKMGVLSFWISRRQTAAQTMATVIIAANGISVAAAWENPIIPTVDGK